MVGRRSRPSFHQECSNRQCGPGGRFVRKAFAQIGEWRPSVVLSCRRNPGSNKPELLKARAGARAHHLVPGAAKGGRQSAIAVKEIEIRQDDLVVAPPHMNGRAREASAGQDKAGLVELDRQIGASFILTFRE